MATQSEFKAVTSRMFGLFLFVAAVGNYFVGQIDFTVLFGAVGFVFVALSGYIFSNPEDFGEDVTVSDRAVRSVTLGGWGLILVTVVVIVVLALG